MSTRPPILPLLLTGWLAAALVACGDSRPSEAQTDTDAGVTVPAPTPDDPVAEWELRLLPAVDRHLQAGRLDSVIRLCQAGLAEDSTRVVLYNLMASAYAAQARYDEATAALKTAVRLSPGFTAGWMNLGGLHTRQGRLEEAIPFLEQAARLDSTAAAAHRRLGEVYLRTGRHGVAADQIRQAMAILPHDATLNFLLGEALEAEERPTDALAAFRRAGRLDPGFVEAHRRASVLARALGDSSLADSLATVRTRLQQIAGGEPEALHTRERLRSVLNNAPEDAIHHARLGGFYLYYGYLPEALALFERAAALEPDNAWLLHEFAGLLSQKGHGPEALDYYLRALAIRPEYGPALLNIGGLLNAMGRPAEALPYLQRALEQAPDDAGVRFYIGVTYLSLDQRDEARRILTEARGLLHDEDTQLRAQIETTLAAMEDQGEG